MRAGKKTKLMLGCCIGLLVLSREKDFAMESEITEYLEETELTDPESVTEENETEILEEMILGETDAEEINIQVMDPLEETERQTEVESQTEATYEAEDSAEQTEKKEEKSETLAITYRIEDQKLESGKTFEDIVIPECAIAEDGSEVVGEVQWKDPVSGIVLEPDMEICGADGENLTWEWTFIPDEQGEYEQAAGDVEVTLYASKSSSKSLFSDMIFGNGKGTEKNSSSGSSNGAASIIKLPSGGASGKWIGSTVTGVGKIGSGNVTDGAKQVEEKLTISHGVVKREETNETTENTVAPEEAVDNAPEKKQRMEPEESAVSTDLMKEPDTDSDLMPETVGKTESETKSVTKPGPEKRTRSVEKGYKENEISDGADTIVTSVKDSVENTVKEVSSERETDNYRKTVEIFFKRLLYVLICGLAFWK